VPAEIILVDDWRCYGVPDSVRLALANIPWLSKYTCRYCWPAWWACRLQFHQWQMRWRRKVPGIVY